MTSPEPRLVVGAAIVDDLTHPSRLFAARRTAPRSLAGGWEFPGGKVEPGELLETALHREVAEELRVEIELGPVVAGPDLVGGARVWPVQPGLAMQVRLARIAKGSPQLVDHDDSRWLSLGELYDVPWLPADLPIVRVIERLMG